MGNNRGVFKVLVGKPEGKGQLGRPRRRRKCNINPYHTKVENMVSS